MQKSQEYFVRKFKEFNTLIFSDELPLPRILLSDAASFLGKCIYRTRRHADGRIERSDFCLRFSIRHSMTENMWEDVVIHEMIHYYIAYNGITDRSSHGPVFRRFMTEINALFNRNVRISHRCVESDDVKHGEADNTCGEASPAKQSGTVITESRRRVIVVARIEFHDGSLGMKVLPKVGPTIHKYCRAWIRQKNVKDIRLYVSDNPFFNRYPSSGALKAYSCDKETLDKVLTDAVALDEKSTAKFFN